MNFLKNNLFKHECHLLTFQEHGHRVLMFSIRGHYFDIFAHILITWALHASLNNR